MNCNFAERIVCYVYERPLISFFNNEVFMLDENCKQVIDKKKGRIEMFIYLKVMQNERESPEIKENLSDFALIFKIYFFEAGERNLPQLSLIKQTHIRLVLQNGL